MLEGREGVLEGREGSGGSVGRAKNEGKEGKQKEGGAGLVDLPGESISSWVRRSRSLLQISFPWLRPYKSPGSRCLSQEEQQKHSVW